MIKNSIYYDDLLFFSTLNGTIFSPFWKSNIEGSIHGIKFSTTKTQIYSSCLESICYRVKQSTDLLKITENSKIVIDGGVSSNEYLSQFQANLLQKDLIRLEGIDGTIRGVFLGCLAFKNKDLFYKTISKNLKGSIIRATKSDRIKNKLLEKFDRFHQLVKRNLS